MQTSLDQPQASPEKVKNILVRHSCSKKVRLYGDYKHPETSYILKYAPKYYKSLTLQTTGQSSLFSKVKKIKKLQKFRGYFNRPVPEQVLFDLLGNNRREIEEVPYTYCPNVRIGKIESWERVNEQKLKYFFNVKRILLPKWNEDSPSHDLDTPLLCKEAFVSHVWNLQKLKSLKFRVRDDNYDNVKWILSKLNRMGGLLKRLENLTLDLVPHTANVQELFQNKTFFSHLTGLNLSMGFDPIFAEVPHMCKNLNSLALAFPTGVDDERLEFRSLLTSMQELTQLKSLDFAWPREGKNFWSNFKPQSSLENLTLRMSSETFMDAGLFEEDNWEEIKEMKTVEFSSLGMNHAEFDLMKMFMTRVLKKVGKLETLKFWLDCETTEDQKYEPILVEDVPHLYESLERFEYRLTSCSGDQSAKFDLKTLKPFKNLKSLKLEGNLECSGDLEEVVSLLEGNQREGGDPVLELKLKRPSDFPGHSLRNTLETIERTKRKDKTSKMIIELKTGMRGDYLEILEGLFNEIQSVHTIEGLKISLDFYEENDMSQFIDFGVLGLLKRYPGLRNLNVSLGNEAESLDWIKMDGEKEQFLISRYW